MMFYLPPHLVGLSKHRELKTSYMMTQCNTCTVFNVVKWIQFSLVTLTRKHVESQIRFENKLGKLSLWLFVLFYGGSCFQGNSGGGRGAGGRGALTWSVCDGAEYGSVFPFAAPKVKRNDNITCQRHIVKCSDKLSSGLCGVMLTF